jgi:hypothetical protein
MHLWYGAFSDWYSNRPFHLQLAAVRANIDSQQFFWYLARRCVHNLDYRDLFEAWKSNNMIFELRRLLWQQKENLKCEQIRLAWIRPPDHMVLGTGGNFQCTFNDRHRLPIAVLISLLGWYIVTELLTADGRGRQQCHRTCARSMRENYFVNVR